MVFIALRLQLDWDYAAPALEVGKSPVDGDFYLLVHLPGTCTDQENATVVADRVRDFIVEYYSATYTAPKDWGCLVRMVKACQQDYLRLLILEHAESR